MIVMKFGGSSIQDAERIRRVCGIIRDRLPRKPVVVVSALRGVTDDLLRLAEAAVRGDMSGYHALETRHCRVAEELGVSRESFRRNLDELSVLLRGISLVKELTPRSLDYVASFGERISARIVAAFLCAQGLDAIAVDAFEIGMITDDHFGSANPLPEAEAELQRSLRRLRGLPVITGYIGRTRGGDITTLGRNGSDYTATIVGAACNAEEVQIWTDVDGVMTADPATVPEARPIEVLSFSEASELAYYGGRVLHPHTLLPAVRRNIPVRVLNTFRPEHPGTLILATPPGHPTGVKSIAFKRHQIVLNVTSPRMLMGYGFLHRIFEVFARHRIVINMVSTSEVSVSVTTDSPRNLPAAVEELQRDFDVTVEHDRAMVCVVGEGLKDTPGIAGEVFGAMRDAGVNVRMISQGASKINLAFVIDSRDVATAVRALHERFFGRVRCESTVPPC